LTRITIVHQAALGDTVLLLPLIRSLRQRFGDASVTLVTRTNLGQMLTLLGLIESHASADDRQHTLWFAPPAGPDPNSRPPWADADLLLSAVAPTTGPNDPWAANARRARCHHPPESLLFFHPRPPPDFPGHVTEWHRRQLASLNLQEAPLPPLRANPAGPVILHPGSGGDAKCWPRERFLALGRDLQHHGIRPTFILGEVEQDRWSRSEIQALQNEFPTYFHMGLYELADKLTRARLFLGNDSGVTHLAAALGIPTLALFGPSNDAQWRPTGPAVQILRPSPPDSANLHTLAESAVLREVLAGLG
jgi:heptosyltransferase III